MRPEIEEKQSTFRGVRLVTVCQMLNASPATIWRWVKTNPGFPKPIKLSPSVTAWDEAELLAWIRDRKGQRQPQQPALLNGDGK